MKNSPFVFVLLASLTLLGFGNLQGLQTLPFDSKKCQSELEVMKGILRTTLDLAGKEFSDGETSEKGGGFKNGPILMNPGNITAFYLSGQGAVFAIPATTISNSFLGHGDHLRMVRKMDELDRGDFNEAMADLQEEMEDLSKELGSLGKELSVKIADQVMSSLPPTPPEPPGPDQATPPATNKMKEKDAKRLSGKEADLQKKLRDLQDKAKARQEELESKKAKFRSNLEQVKGVLVQTLANYGDSLTTVKPQEFINLVIVDEDGSWLTGNAEGKREIISVQKSIISDYKTGRLTLEEFKHKVLNYVN